MLKTVEFPGEQADASTLPVHPRGLPWAYAMGHDGDLVSFADTAGELVSVFIDGYDQLDDSDGDHDIALELRYNHLMMLAAHYQAEANLQAMTEGLLDEADEDVFTALYANRDQPYTGPTRWTGPKLILISLDYDPFSPLPRPVGENVLILDPFRETTYLHSLHALEFIAFGTYSGAPAPVAVRV